MYWHAHDPHEYMHVKYALTNIESGLAQVITVHENGTAHYKLRAHPMVGTFLVSSFASVKILSCSRNRKTSHPPKERPRSPTVTVHVQTKHCSIHCSRRGSALLSTHSVSPTKRSSWIKTFPITNSLDSSANFGKRPSNHARATICFS
jgi:hypothetical protein